MDYFERKLDDKNRLTIPAELRHEFESGVVITPGFGAYLHLYSQKVWLSEMEPALTGDILSEEVADVNVAFRKGKTVAALDAKQGRVQLASHHLAHAEIAKDVEAVRSGSYWRIMAKSN